MEWSEADRLWKAASQQFAERASGEIHIFQNAAGVSLNSTWAQVEYPALTKNPDVTNTVYHIVGGQ